MLSLTMPLYLIVYRFFFLIYLAVLGFSWGTRNLRCHVRDLVAACGLLAAAFGI